MRLTRSLLVLLVAMVLIAGACGGDSDTTDSAADDTDSATEADDASSNTEEDTTTSTEGSTSSQSSTTTTEATTTTSEDAEESTTVVTSEAGLPATPVAAFLSQSYLFGSEQGIPSADQLPFPADSVTAHWYQSDGFYVVVYGALDPSLLLCPGNSIQTTSGFANVSNAPLNGADCSFAPTVAEAPNGVVTCNRMVSYVTLIPAGTEGVLFGTIEVMTDGLGVGLTSQAPADPANMPEIDRGLIDC